MYRSATKSANQGSYELESDDSQFGITGSINHWNDVATICTNLTTIINTSSLIVVQGIDELMHKLYVYQ